MSFIFAALRGIWWRLRDFEWDFRPFLSGTINPVIDLTIIRNRSLFRGKYEFLQRYEGDTVSYDLNVFVFRITHKTYDLSIVTEKNCYCTALTVTTVLWIKAICKDIFCFRKCDTESAWRIRYSVSKELLTRAVLFLFAKRKNDYDAYGRGLDDLWVENTDGADEWTRSGE